MNNKLKSRKFIVWLVATIIMFVCCIMAFITKDNTAITSFSSIWGGISMFYIGGNVIQKFAENKESNV